MALLAKAFRRRVSDGLSWLFMSVLWCSDVTGCRGSRGWFVDRVVDCAQVEISEACLNWIPHFKNQAISQNREIFVTCR